MKNIKKLKSYGKAVATSALLVGATVTGAAGLAAAQSGSSGDATLADYPSPFVDDEGNLDSTVVVGTDGKQADVVSAIDIAGNLGNNAFSSETVEGSAGAVDGDQEEDTIRDSIEISIDASDYSGFVRETMEDDDNNDVFVTESADFSGQSEVNETDAEIGFDQGEITYEVKYSPGFMANDTVVLLGEEYELTSVADDEVDLGSSKETDVQVGDSFDHGPYTVEVTGKTSGDDPNIVVRVSEGEESLETAELDEDTDPITVGDDDEFEVSAETVIFYNDGTSDVTLKSTYTDTTLEEGEDLEMDDRYQVASDGISVNSDGDTLQGITLENNAQTVDEPEDEDETDTLEAGDTYEGPNGYFNLVNQGLSNEATEEIGISSGGEVDFTDAQSFDADVDMSELNNGNGISSDDVTTGINSDEGYVPLQVTDFSSGSGSSNAETTVEYENFEETFTSPDTLSAGSTDEATEKVDGAGQVAADDLFTGNTGLTQNVYYQPETNSNGNKVDNSDNGNGRTVLTGFSTISTGVDYSDVEVTASVDLSTVDQIGDTNSVELYVSAGSSPTYEDSATYTYDSGNDDTTETLSVTLGDGSGSSDTTGLDLESGTDQVNIEVRNSNSGAVTVDNINYAISDVETDSATTGQDTLDFNAENDFNDADDNSSVTFDVVSQNSGSVSGVDSGYGFTVAPTFEDTDGDDNADQVSFSDADDKLTTQFGADLTWSSNTLTVAEEDQDNEGQNINVNYEGPDGDISSSGITFGTGSYELTDTDDGDSTLTEWGSAVELDSDSSASVVYPDEQREQLTALGMVGEGSGEGTVMMPTGWASGSAQLDSEASTDENLVLVGGPLVNDLTGDLADQGSTWNSSQYESNQGVGVLDLVNDAFEGNNALVVAGWQADDTSAAAQYLVENAGAEELEGRTTVQVDTQSGELVQ